MITRLNIFFAFVKIFSFAVPVYYSSCQKNNLSILWVFCYHIIAKKSFQHYLQFSAASANQIASISCFKNNIFTELCFKKVKLKMNSLSVIVSAMSRGRTRERDNVLTTPKHCRSFFGD